MKSQTRTSARGGSGRLLKFPLGLLGALTTLFSVMALLASAAPAFAEPLTGAIFSTDSTCTGVDLNIYSSKDDVYIDGGPQKHPGAAGLPAGQYYVKVTDPSGATLLGTSLGSGDDTPVAVDAEGEFEACYQLSAILIKASGLPENANPGYDDTPNLGGEYKVWVSTQSNFPNDEDKTDNFKVIVEEEEEEEEIPPADALTASKDAHPRLERTFKWEIEKEVDKTKVNIADGGTATFEYTVSVKHDGGTDSGWAVSGKITVNNPNSGEVTGVDIEDSINDANATCKVFGGEKAVIPAEGNAKFGYECTYSAEPSSKSETNTATVSWDEQTVEGVEGPLLLDEGEVQATAPVDWESTEPDVIDGNVEVTDTLGGFLGEVSWEDESPTEFLYPVEFEEDPAGTCTGHDNTATFTSTSDTGTNGSAEQEVEVCVGADLEVEKTATPSFKKTFPWSITKEVDKTSVSQVGGNATFKYTIKATKGTGVDSDWAASGEITVSNPNDWEAITVDVTDAINDASSICSVSGGSGVSIPASGSKTFEYSCTYSAAPSSGSETNTATATWDKGAASTPNGSATGTAPVNWANPTLVDDCIEVTDTVDEIPTTLDNSLCESKTYTPELTFPVPKSDCVTHNNTAAFETEDTETTGKASQSVKVCGPADTGALTMGFWQNKNGQGIIKGGSSTGGVCNSGTWLRGYAPFQDLSPTAKCTEVADYVTKVIKAANASGAALNAMLKAQMLATALDVYFSDSGLGGNKIGAPKPIGGQKIDLTKVCKNIPACTVFENTNSAFGGEPSLTVSQLLAYAASKSNLGGSSWYGQVKATQELAKDTFDAINNEVAFGA